MCFFLVGTLQMTAIFALLQHIKSFLTLPHSLVGAIPIERLIFGHNKSYFLNRFNVGFY
jgi:hypothetical protein